MEISLIVIYLLTVAFCSRLHITFFLLNRSYIINLVYRAIIIHKRGITKGLFYLNFFCNVTVLSKKQHAKCSCNPAILRNKIWKPDLPVWNVVVLSFIATNSQEAF